MRFKHLFAYYFLSMHFRFTKFQNYHYKNCNFLLYTRMLLFQTSWKLRGNKSVLGGVPWQSAGYPWEGTNSVLSHIQLPDLLTNALNQAENDFPPWYFIIWLLVYMSRTMWCYPKRWISMCSLRRVSWLLPIFCWVCPMCWGAEPYCPWVGVDMDSWKTCICYTLVLIVLDGVCKKVWIPTCDVIGEL